MDQRYVCIHGHFYQPPRENPWLEAIELEESAYPDHDWNERIARECYGPMSRARLLDQDGWIKEMVNNYSLMSFNIGPTLMEWLRSREPEIYNGLIEADKASILKFSGHGSAMAQVYNHPIMPLCNARDKVTQVKWAVDDFQYHFSRYPEGIWLAETAVDIATLEVLADFGIKYTVLAPRQAHKVRKLNHDEFEDVNGAVDPSTTYVCKLPSGKEINLFFYDGPISQAVAFEGLLHSGKKFVDRLLSGFDKKRDWSQLVHIATDGESYGHHHRHGDMALADVLQRLDSHSEIKLTNYGEYLSLHPATHEVKIYENSSWSCVHGVERWRSNCGCCSGGRSEWNQNWRAPLRESLDWLRDSILPLYEKEAALLLKDPWEARNDYRTLMFDRSQSGLDSWLERHAKQNPPSKKDVARILMLLEMQRHALLMYTSCGWFFDEISGIETVQILRYAGRVVQLAQDLFSADLSEGFLTRLSKAPSNLPELVNGRGVYERYVQSAVTDLHRVGAHYAISSLFSNPENKSELFCYEVHESNSKVLTMGKTRLFLGSAILKSKITKIEIPLSYAAWHLGDHNLSCGVRDFRDDNQFEEMIKEAEQAFVSGDVLEVVRFIDAHFGEKRYSIASLFRDEQHVVLRQILEPTLSQVDVLYRQVYEQCAPIAQFLRQQSLPVPRRLQLPAELVLNHSIRKAFEEVPPNSRRAQELIEEASRQGIKLDQGTIGHSVRSVIEKNLEVLQANESGLEVMSSLILVAEVVSLLTFPVELWQSQGMLYEHLLKTRFEVLGKLNNELLENEWAIEWIELFSKVANFLKVRIPNDECS